MSRIGSASDTGTTFVFLIMGEFPRVTWKSNTDNADIMQTVWPALPEEGNRAKQETSEVLGNHFRDPSLIEGLFW